jgi:hypothetical protein
MFHNDFNPSKCLITAEDATLKLLKKFTFTATLSVGLFFAREIQTASDSFVWRSELQLHNNCIFLVALGLNSKELVESEAKREKKTFKS